MKHTILVGLALLATFAAAHAQAPSVILGRSTGDKFLSGFWSQNQNASNLVVGVNLNHGDTLFDDGVLPTLITSKFLSGTFEGTNTFQIRTYDDAAAAFETFNFMWTAGLPATADTVARVAAVETLQNKTLVATKFGDGSGGYLSGIVKANGSSPATTVAGLAGETNIWIGGPNRIKIVDGVIAEFEGDTNIAATGITSLNGLEEVAQLFAAGTSGSDFGIVSSGSTHTFNLPTASSTVRGALSAADWTTFNSKAPGTATLTALSAYNQNGLISQVSENTFAGRTIVSGDSSIEVVNGDGVSGDIDIRVAMGAGYFYIPKVEGTPSGTPESQADKVPIVYDTTGHALWVYDGGWLKIQAAAP